MAPDRKALEEAGRRKLEEFRKAKAAKAAASQQKGSPSPGLSPVKPEAPPASTPAPPVPVNVVETAQPWTNGAGTAPPVQEQPGWPTPQQQPPAWPSTEPASYAYSSAPAAAPQANNLYSNGHSAAPAYTSWDTTPQQQFNSIPFASGQTPNTYFDTANGTAASYAAPPTSADPFASIPTHEAQQPSGASVAAPDWLAPQHPTSTAALFSSQAGAQPQPYQSWAPEPPQPLQPPPTTEAAPQTTWSVVTNASALFGGGDDSPHASQPDPFGSVPTTTATAQSPYATATATTTATAPSTYPWGQSSYDSPAAPTAAAPAAAPAGQLFGVEPVPFPVAQEPLQLNSTAALFPPSPESHPPFSVATTQPDAAAAAAGAYDTHPADVTAAPPQPSSPPPQPAGTNWWEAGSSAGTSSTIVQPWLATPTSTPAPTAANDTLYASSGVPGTTTDYTAANTDYAGAAGYTAATTAAVSTYHNVASDAAAYTTVTTNALYDTSPVSSSYTQGASTHVSPGPDALTPPPPTTTTTTTWQQPHASDATTAAAIPDVAPVPFNSSYTGAGSGDDGSTGAVQAAGTGSTDHVGGTAGGPPVSSWWTTTNTTSATTAPQAASADFAAALGDAQHTTSTVAGSSFFTTATTAGTAGADAAAITPGVFDTPATTATPGAGSSIPFTDMNGQAQAESGYDWMGTGTGGTDAYAMTNTFAYPTTTAATTIPDAVTGAVPFAAVQDNAGSVQVQAAPEEQDALQSYQPQDEQQQSVATAGDQPTADSGAMAGPGGVVQDAAASDAAGTATGHPWMVTAPGASQTQDGAGSVQGDAGVSKVSDAELTAWAYGGTTGTGASNLYSTTTAAAYGAGTSAADVYKASQSAYGYTAATGNAFGSYQAASDGSNLYGSTGLTGSVPYMTNGVDYSYGNTTTSFAPQTSSQDVAPLQLPHTSAIPFADVTTTPAQEVANSLPTVSTAQESVAAPEPSTASTAPQHEAAAASPQGSQQALSLADAFASFVHDDEPNSKPLSTHSSASDQPKDKREEGGKKSRFAWLFGTPKTPYNPHSHIPASSQSAGGTQDGSAPASHASSLTTTAAAAASTTQPGPEPELPPATTTWPDATAAASGAAQPPDNTQADVSTIVTSWGSAVGSATTNPTDSATTTPSFLVPQYTPPAVGDSLPGQEAAGATPAVIAHDTVATTTTTAINAATSQAVSYEVPGGYVSTLDKGSAGVAGSGHDQVAPPQGFNWPGNTSSTTTTTTAAASIAQRYAAKWPAEDSKPYEFALQASSRPATPAVPDSTLAQHGLSHSSSFVFENNSSAATGAASAPAQPAVATSEPAATDSLTSATAAWSSYQPAYFSFLPPSAQSALATTTTTAPTALPASPSTMLSAPYTYTSYQQDASNSLTGGSSQDNKSFLESYLDNLLRFDESLNKIATDATAQEGGDAGAAAGADGAGDGQHGSSSDGGGTGDHPHAHADEVAAADGDVGGAHANHHHDADEDRLSSRASGSLPRPEAKPHLWSQAPPHPPHGNGFARVGSGTQFSVLHQHIEDLTQEKMELQRGLAAQVKLHAAIEEENAAMVERLNTQGKQIEALQSKLERYEMELNAQVLAVEGMAAEREAARAGQAEAADRATALAGEVVNLEAALRQAKSHGLKMEREVEVLRQQVEKAERQLGSTRKESSSAADEVGRLTQEKRALFVRLKQTEARLSKLLDDTGASARTREAVFTGLSPVKAELVEQEVQCDLLSEADVAQLRSELQQAQAAAHLAAQELAAAHDAARVASERADAAVTRSTQLEEQLQSQRATAESLGTPVMQPSTPRGLISRLSQMSNLTPPTDHDPMSALITDKLLASIPQTTLAALSVAKDVPEALLGPIAQLGRWLPMGPVSAGSPEGAVVEEQLRLVTSIHTLLNQQEEAYGVAVEQLEVLEIENTGLRRANEDLRRKLEMTMQRLELSLAQGAGMEATLTMAGLVPTPTTAATSAIPAQLTSAAPTASNDVSTPTAGLPRSPDTTMAPPPHAQDPVSPFLQQTVTSNRQETANSTLPAAQPYMIGSGQQMMGMASANSLQGVGAATTPPRFDPVGHQLSQDLLAAELSTPQRRGWLGFLFAPRPKKRVRNALL